MNAITPAAPPAQNVTTSEGHLLAFATKEAAIAAIRETGKDDTSAIAHLLRCIGYSAFDPVAEGILLKEAHKAFELDKVLIKSLIKEGSLFWELEEAKASVEGYDVEKWNKRYRLAANGNASVYILDGLDVQSHTLAGFRVLKEHAFDFVDGKGGPRKVEHFDMWRADERAAKCAGVAFRPNEVDRYTLPKDHPKYPKPDRPPPFNTWRGWAISPRPADMPMDRMQCDRIRHHAFRVLCNRDPFVFRDLEMLLAWRLQNAGDLSKKLPVAIVVPGQEGLGKSLFFETVVGAPYGRHMVVVSQEAQVTGQFNSHIAEALYFVGEEAFFGDNPKINGPLKQLLSGHKMLCRRMYADPFEVDNFCDFTFLSNNERPVPAEVGSRRYFVLPSKDVEVPTQAHFDVLVAEIKAGGPEAYADYMRRWTPSPEVFARLWDDVERWEAGTTLAPADREKFIGQPADWSRLNVLGKEGKARDQMIAAGLPAFERFFISWVHGSFIPKDHLAPYQIGEDLDHLDFLSESRDYPVSDIAKAYKLYLDKALTNIHDRGRAVSADPSAVGRAITKMLGKSFVHEMNFGSVRRLPGRDEMIELLRGRHGAYGVYLDILDGKD